MQKILQIILDCDQLVTGWAFQGSNYFGWDFRASPIPKFQRPGPLAERRGVSGDTILEIIAGKVSMPAEGKLKIELGFIVFLIACAIAKGLLVDGKRTWPGVELGCKCVSRAVLPWSEEQT